MSSDRESGQCLTPHAFSFQTCEQISYVAELLSLLAEHCFSKFVKPGHGTGDREPRVIARSSNPLSPPRLPSSALRARQQLRLLGGNDALTKLAVARVLDR